MRKLFTFIIALLTLLSIGSPIYAQEATATPDTGWPIEERCVGAPTKPPKGWSYDGTILMTGYAGIHGVNAKWDTPRVLIFLDDNELWGGSLSPDGKWYASPYGTRETTETYNTITETHEIHVYNLTQESNPLVIKPAEAITFQQTHGSIYWKDNRQFIFGTNDGTNLIDFSTGKKASWNYLDNIFDGSDHVKFDFSPDWSRVIYYNYDQERRSFAVIRDLIYQTDFEKLNLRKPVVWKHDSSGFIADISQNLFYGKGDLEEGLALYNKNGDVITSIFKAPDGQQFGRLNAAWSSDNRYFAFIAFDYYADNGNWYVSDYARKNTLYIADMQNQKIINTCLPSGVGLAWHPNKNQLVFLTPGDGLRDVMIYDLDTYKLYAVAKHMVGYNDRDFFRSATEDEILMWRAD